MAILEAKLELLNRHSFGLVWECIELLKSLEKKAPTIIAFLNLDGVKHIYDLVKPSLQSEELCRIRNSLSFHFGVNDHKGSLKTLKENLKSRPTAVLTTKIGEESWYEIASESQAHLLTRPITNIVNDTSTYQQAMTDANAKGLDMLTLKMNLLCLFKSTIEYFVEECYLD